MSADNSLANIIEALLFGNSEPLSIDQLVHLTDCDDKSLINQALEEIETRYQSHVLEFKKLASGYRFQVRSSYSQWVSRLFSEKPQKYSRTILETLAIIAYRQPVTRADIEAIRGVAVSTSVIRTLLERNWVKVAGHRDVPGRPAIYITTKTFLDYFNLSRLDELPSIEALMQEDGESTETPKQEKTFLPKVGLSDEVTAASSAVLDELDESLVEEPRSDSDALVTNLERNQEMVEEVDHE